MRWLGSRMGRISFCSFLYQNQPLWFRELSQEPEQRERWKVRDFFFPQIVMVLLNGLFFKIVDNLSLQVSRGSGAPRCVPIFQGTQNSVISFSTMLFVPLHRVEPVELNTVKTEPIDHESPFPRNTLKWTSLYENLFITDFCCVCFYPL